MNKAFNYGVYGLGRIGKVHAAIVKQQEQQIATKVMMYKRRLWQPKMNLALDL